MKKTLFLFLTFTFTTLTSLTSCSLSNDGDNGPTTIIITEWNLVNVTGGIAGVDNAFTIGDITWFFDNSLLVLSVTNSNTADLEDGLDEGNYNISYLEQNGNLFLVVEDFEFGQITFSGTDNEDMTIDQNSLTTGQGSDGFVYTFKKTTRTVEI